MTQLSILKEALQQAHKVICEAEKDISLFGPMANQGDETAADLICTSTANAADAILELYQEIGKHAPSLKTISNGL
mgnify:CR=1 FL=1